MRTPRVIFHAILALCCPAVGWAYWHVTSVTFIGSVNGQGVFSFPEQYIYTNTSGTAIHGIAHNAVGGCPTGGGVCDTASSLTFREQWFCPNLCATYYGSSCGTAPPGWDSLIYTVPMPHASPTAIFRRPDTSVYYRYMMLHMGQGNPQCPGTEGLYGSLGIDFSSNGLAWTAYPGNPILTDSKWSAQPLSFSPGSSSEKAEVVYLNGTYYMMAIVANPNPGYENSLVCSNTRTLTYLLSSTDLVNWSRVGGSGLVRTSGLVWPPNPYNGWLVNVNMAYDPATGYVYMTRAYRSNATCPNLGILPDRIQVYRKPGGIETPVLAGTSWELLIDLGCNSSPSYPYQQPLSFAPDAAQIRHNGLGYVVFNPGGGISLMISNGNQNSCFPNAPKGVYEVWIGP